MLNGRRFQYVHREHCAPVASLRGNLIHDLSFGLSLRLRLKDDLPTTRATERQGGSTAKETLIQYHWPARTTQTLCQKRKTTAQGKEIHIEDSDAVFGESRDGDSSCSRLASPCDFYSFFMSREIKVAHRATLHFNYC